MKNEYRALVEAEICAEGKLRDLSEQKLKAEQTLSSINHSIQYQQGYLTETRQRLQAIEAKAFGLEAQVAS